MMIKNIINSKEFVFQMFKRDFFSGYKKSYIGITWVFISPLVGIASWIFLQKAGMLTPGDVGIPYPAYVLIGTSMWGLFVGFFNAASATLKSGQSLVMQVNYPHEALLFKETAQYLADFLIVFLMNVIVLFLYGVIPSVCIIFFPIVALPLFLLGAAIGLISSMVAVVAFDLSKAINILIGLMMYLTPVIYSDSVSSPMVQTFIRLNPLTHLVCSARDIIIYGRLYNPVGYFICAGLSLVFFLISWRLFFIAEKRIIERMV